MLNRIAKHVGDLFVKRELNIHNLKFMSIHEIAQILTKIHSEISKGKQDCVAIDISFILDHLNFVFNNDFDLYPEEIKTPLEKISAHIHLFSIRNIRYLIQSFPANGFQKILNPDQIQHILKKSFDDIYYFCALSGNMDFNHGNCVLREILRRRAMQPSLLTQDHIHFIFHSMIYHKEDSIEIPEDIISHFFKFPKPNLDQDVVQTYFKDLIAICFRKKRFFSFELNLIFQIVLRYSDLLIKQDISDALVGMIPYLDRMNTRARQERNPICNVIGALVKILEQELSNEFIEEIFEKIKLFSAQDTLYFIRAFAPMLSAQTLQTTFATTSSYLVLEEINRYIRGPGRHRHIPLPFRPDVQVQERAIDGVAFDIHHFADKLDLPCLGFMERVLKYSDSKKQTYGLEYLEGKIDKSKLTLEDKQKAREALAKIRQSQDPKLQRTFSVVASFLNADKAFWNEGHENLDDRWNLWLQQSFVESGKAYEGENGTSCVKGIYERIFTGFRSMNSIVDGIFCCPNLISSYFPTISAGYDSKLIFLSRAEILAKIIDSLLDLHLENVELDTDEIASPSLEALKNVCRIEFESEITMALEAQIKLLSLKIPSVIFDDLKRSIINIWQQRKSFFDTKTKDFFDHIEYFDLALGTDSSHPIDFIETINAILAEVKTGISVKEASQKASERISERIPRRS